jgi:uncharacterized protein (TIGR02147 family)
MAGRNVTSSFVERFVSGFSLEKNEARYFIALFKFSQADTSERELYYDQLISLNRTPKKVMDRRIFQYYQNWYNGTIRALLNFFGH